MKHNIVRKKVSSGISRKARNFSLIVAKIPPGAHPPLYPEVLSLPPNRSLKPFDSTTSLCTPRQTAKRGRVKTSVRQCDPRNGKLFRFWGGGRVGREEKELKTLSADNDSSALAFIFFGGELNDLTFLPAFRRQAGGKKMIPSRVADFLDA